MHDPVLCPHGVRDVVKAVGVAQGVAELGAKDTGKGFDGEEETLSGREPGLTVGGQTTCRDQIVDVGMEGQVASPSVENADHADLSTDEARVLGELLCG